MKDLETNRGLAKVECDRRTVNVFTRFWIENVFTHFKRWTDGRKSTKVKGTQSRRTVTDDEGKWMKVNADERKGKSFRRWTQMNAQMNAKGRLGERRFWFRVEKGQSRGELGLIKKMGSDLIETLSFVKEY